MKGERANIGVIFLENRKKENKECVGRPGIGRGFNCDWIGFTKVRTDGANVRNGSYGSVSDLRRCVAACKGSSRLGKVRRGLARFVAAWQGSPRLGKVRRGSQGSVTALKSFVVDRNGSISDLKRVVSARKGSQRLSKVRNGLQRVNSDS